MNEHESIRQLLALAAADALEAEELRRVEQHVLACDHCRRELETWTQYAQALHQLPQPSVPAGLAERALGRALQQRAAVAVDRASAVLLILIAVIGWAAGGAVWLVVRGVAGQTANILGISLLGPAASWVLWIAATWISSAVAAAALARGRDLRKSL